MNILGISEEHDAGIAFLLNGKFMWAASEERYTRHKLQTGTPTLSLDQFVKTQGFSRQNILKTAVAIGSLWHVETNFGDKFTLRPFPFFVERSMSITGLDRLVWGTNIGVVLIGIIARVNNIFRKKRITAVLQSRHIQPTSFQFVDHHTSHASSAYATSGWNDAMVVTLDASGDGLCSKVFIGKNGRMKEVHREYMYHSPGYYYSYVTQLLGFKLGREGKVTGLAANGDPSKTFPIFWGECEYDEKNHRFINHGGFRTAELMRLGKLIAGFSREDVAAGIQKHIESTVVPYIRDMVGLYAPSKQMRVAVSGGIFANVRLNQKIAALPSVSQLFVYPHMGDGGLAAGAAYFEYMCHSGKPVSLPHVYLGDDITEVDIKEAINTYGSEIRVVKPKSLTLEIAKYLAKGKVVAVVRGNMEYGPRALGHRTLLYQTTDPSVNDWLNKRLKRSEFMPFAPILKAPYLGLYFNHWKKVLPSLPYMTVTVDCNARCKKEAPAIVHVDGTARPQIVRRDTQPFIWDILTEYERLTGRKILINTSYNIHEEPIVRTATDAVKTFLDGHIDVLAVGDRIVTLKP